MTRAVVLAGLLVAVTMTGCVYALHPYNAPSRQSLHIQPPGPERYTVRVDEGESYPVAADGRVDFDVPALPRGCAVYLFGLVKVADHRSEDVRAIHVLEDGNVVRRLSLSQLSELPLGSDGTRVLALK
jgi:hypothetical protein